MLLTGNVHFSELSKTDEGPYPLYDFTSSGLTHVNDEYPQAANDYRVAGPYVDLNFGLVEIDWEASPTPLITLQIIDVEGRCPTGTRTSSERTAGARDSAAANLDSGARIRSTIRSHVVILLATMVLIAPAIRADEWESSLRRRYAERVHERSVGREGSTRKGSGERGVSRGWYGCPSRMGLVISANMGSPRVRTRVCISARADVKCYVFERNTAEEKAVPGKGRGHR